MALSYVKRFLPFTDIREYGKSDVARDLLAALAVTFVSVPSGIAYAVIAGLPPATGLYAAALPTLVGSIFRSSRHVVTGPTNALSLLVGSGVAVLAGLDPLTVGITLALLVGLFQFFAGVLRLGTVVDYISNPVVLGYITGAGLLIGIGQLPSVTATVGTRGNVFEKIGFWLQGVGDASLLAVAMALGTVAAVVILRKIHRKIPGAILVMGISTALAYFLDLRSKGMLVVADLKPVPNGLPPLTLPDLSLVETLIPLAIATTVLSLVECSAVARAIATKTGQRLDTSVEFAGQGLANLAAAFSGGYPTSGSPARSAVNTYAGAHGRLAGIFAGLMMLLVLLVAGPVVNYTPVAALAGLLLVVAAGLIDLNRIKLTLHAPWSDRFAFVATLLGTWFLPLDQAIYLGVGISLVMFLRQARLLVLRELAVDGSGRLQEVEAEGHTNLTDGDPRDVDLPDGDSGQTEPGAVRATCSAIRVLHIEGHLFFGVVGELQAALDRYTLDPRVKVLILRLKRGRSIDVTVASAIQAAAERQASQGSHLLLAGVRPDVLRVLKQTDVVDAIGHQSIFTSRSRWFESTRAAIEQATALLDRDALCEDCPLACIHPEENVSD